MKFNIAEADVAFGTSGVRGLVSDLTDQVVYAYASAFWNAVGKGSKVVIGHDLRPSSPGITQICIAALKDLGVDTVYVGSLATPAIALYAAYLGVPAVVVTGSHIPFDRNGIKFYSCKGEINKQDERVIMSSQVDVPSVIERRPLPDPVLEAATHYISRYTNFFGQDLCVGKKIAIYQHSSVARDLLSDLFKALGAEVVTLGRTESFVPIDTEAVRAEDVQQAALWAKEIGFDLLVSTDGDADRPLIADESGQFFRGDILGVLTAYCLKAQCVVTPVSSNTLLEISEWFAETVRTKIGSPYVIAGMEGVESDSVVGFEANGGFLVGSEITLNDAVLAPLATRDAVLPMLAIIALARQGNTRASQLVNALPSRFTASDRIANIPTNWSVQLLERLSSGALSIATLIPEDLGVTAIVDQTDGYRATLTCGTIIHLRPSGNAPELRCYVESASLKEANSLCQTVLKQVSQTYKRES